MTNEDVQRLEQIMYEIEEGIYGRIGSEMDDGMRQDMIANLMINLGTTLYSKVLLMTEAKDRPELVAVFEKITREKVTSGEKLIESIAQALRQAGAILTCRPPPTKH